MAEANETIAEDENLKHVSGKLEELNSILRSTQRKINNFTSPFSNYLKSKILGAPVAREELKEEMQNTPEEASTPNQTKQDGTLLDSMIDRFDNAQLGMENQNKQMKSQEESGPMLHLFEDSATVIGGGSRFRPYPGYETDESEKDSEIDSSDDSDEDEETQVRIVMEKQRLQHSPDIDDLDEMLNQRAGRELGKVYQEKLLQRFE